MKVLKPVALSLLCAAVLVMVNARTSDAIQENRTFHADKLVREMAGPYGLESQPGGYRLYADNNPVGWIHPATTEHGYNGSIEMLVAHLDTGQVINVRVTTHRETPGLGDDIDLAVSSWILQFNGRSLQDTDWQLAPTGDIDGITGATITARAVTDAIRETLEDE